jgi:hypothetical protein
VQVLELFPDLTLAVEEEEPALAHEFFSTVKSWVGELYGAVTEVQRNNQANARAIRYVCVIYVFICYSQKYSVVCSTELLSC